MSAIAKEDTKVTITSELSVVHCGKCGGSYAIAECFRRRCEKHGEGWHCPYCKCGWGYYGDSSPEARFKRQIERLERDRDWQREKRHFAEKEADHFRRSRDGMKGALVKVKKRVSAGVCPCCNRNFKDLAAHMANKHPGYGDSES